jgi:hypothetical protein
MPKREQPRVVRHAKVEGDAESGFWVTCKPCNFVYPEVFATERQAQAAVDMHEVIRHNP